MKYTALFSLLYFSLIVSGQTIEELNASKKELQDKIKLTNSLISKNSKVASTSLHQLEMMNNKIYLESNMLVNLNSEIKQINISLNQMDKEIDALNVNLDKIKEEYGQMIYTTWRMTKGGKQFHYVLAGYDMDMVYRRFRYIVEFNRYRRNQGELILEKQEEIEAKKKFAVQKRSDKNQLITEKNHNILALNSTKKEKENYVKTLKSEKQKLRSQLKKQQKKADELEKFIQEIIQREILAAKAKEKSNEFGLSPEESVISANFADNKGRLPWPLTEGVIVQRFGNYKPEGLSKVNLNSNGLDFVTIQGASARAVFNGIVIGVYALPGYNTGVIIKHGNFFSFYANLEEVFVKKGQNVSIKQRLGRIFTDDEKKKTLLHFEIYEDKSVMNPELWLTK